MISYVAAITGSEIPLAPFRNLTLLLENVWGDTLELVIYEVCTVSSRLRGLPVDSILNRTAGEL